jgi:hypothetical protein
MNRNGISVPEMAVNRLQKTHNYHFSWQFVSVFKLHSSNFNWLDVVRHLKFMKTVNKVEFVETEQGQLVVLYGVWVKLENRDLRRKTLDKESNIMHL